MAIADTLPALQDRHLTVRRLQRYARAFDDISDETGARYSAAAFVTWLQREIAAGADRRERRAENIRAGVIRQWETRPRCGHVAAIRSETGRT